MVASNFELVREFHEKFNVPVLKRPRFPPKDRTDLRRNLIEEESREVIDALDGGRIDEIAKELADLLYVVYGTAHEYGIQLDAVFAEVHRSNMTKLGEDGKPVIRPEDGKVLKGPNYCKANVESVLRNTNNVPQYDGDRENEKQLVRIAEYLGRDARHSEDGTIAGLVIQELERCRPSNDNLKPKS